MALATRSSRRASGRRWLAVGVVVTILVLLIDASVRSRSPDPPRRLAGSAWADKVFALVQQSDVQGRQLEAFLADTTPTSGAAVRLRLHDLRSAAASTLHATRALQAPADLSVPAGLVDSCLTVRSQEAAAVDRAVTRALTAPIGVGAINRAGGVLASAVRHLGVADQACALFGTELPTWLHARAPTSQWITASSGPGAAGATPGTESVFLTALHRRVNLQPVATVAIEAVTTTPSAVGNRSGTQILAPGHHLSLQVVVGNPGNQAEDNLTVRASIAPAAGTSSAAASVSALAPGTSDALTVGPLDPPIGQKVTLTVTLTPGSGSKAKAQTTTLAFEMPSPNTAAPTTSSTSSTTTSTSTTASGTSGTAGSSGSATTATPSTTTASGTGTSGTSGTSGTTGTSGSPPTT